MAESNRDANEYLDRLTVRLFALNTELNKATADEEAGDVYLEKWRALHKLKEEYKRRTGIYPILPPLPAGSDSAN